MAIALRTRRDSSRAASPGGSTPTAISDEALVVHAQQGDSWARNALVRRHLREVLELVSWLLGSQQEADDVVQDVFVAVFSRLDQLRNPRAFRGWLLRIAVNLTRKAIRRQRIRRLCGLDRTVEDTTLEALVAEQVRPEVCTELAALDEVLRKMPTEQRIVWILRYVEGHTIADIGRLCSCSLATTKRRLAKAEARVAAVSELKELRHE